ncbi:unnamed protein product [Prorocentrum cordatum]|uniref:Uncharacterized protein n=1 Tax=Prorocentrum cordatum TaxID=2364126 RepID=A0ABN9VD10_9DINO|nr:unnamed protein product [Polarella glacialis]
MTCSSARTSWIGAWTPWRRIRRSPWRAAGVPLRRPAARRAADAPARAAGHRAGAPMAQGILHPGLGNSASFEAMSVFTDSANAMVALHVFVVWKYHHPRVFLRDALMARHVTRIALERPPPREDPTASLPGPVPDFNAPCSPGPPGGPAAGAAAAPAPLLAGAGAEPLAVLVETGPWARRLELRRPAPPGPAAGPEGGGAAPEGQRPTPFGQLLQVGVLHVDRLGGETLDPAALRELLGGDLQIAKDRGRWKWTCSPPGRRTWTRKGWRRS